MSRLCMPNDVRKKLGLSVSEAPDETVYEYIDEAQIDVRKDTSFYVFDDVLTGKIDGNNTTFSTTNNFIADRNFDSTVTVDDIDVYAWVDKENPATKSSVSLSTIYPEYGKVILASAPVSKDQVTANYYYYYGPINFDIVKEACADLAAYYYAQREILLMPKQWMHGAYRFMKSGEYKDLLVKYYSRIDRIANTASDRGEHDEPSIIRSEP
jgi:hypothetical protein